MTTAEARTHSLEESLKAIRKHAGYINLMGSTRGEDRLRHIHPDPTRAETILNQHNEELQGTILIEWERLAAMLGEQKLALENGFAVPEDLTDLPESNRPENERQDIREALTQVLRAADRINAQNQPEELVPQTDIHQHNEDTRTLLLENWERLAHLSSHHLLAIRNGQEQPVIQYDAINGTFQALGVAAYHAAAAASQYRELAQQIHSTPELRESAEREARIAASILFVIQQETDPEHPMAENILLAAHQMRSHLTQERARALGDGPVQQESSSRSSLDPHQL